MERRRFITDLGQTTAAICSIGFLAACSKSGDNPTPDPGPGGGGPGGGGARLTANLSSELTAIGSSKTSGNVIVIRTGAGNVASSFSALSLICTHEQCTIAYDAAASDFKCPCHGSEFSVTGSVNQGPASAPLTKYTVTINGNTLTVN
ncbi:MAG: Rieske 2Fe-2S domain-containing protein [Chitinophagaceae bacterium]|nr:Rieske 2Fe-2S domain-containing protein [Chitinophagaceae bacterium]MCW5929411.1 Rieske 2Fe-2S domain-containing protein [Chitinophagaceae bacterium]